jgi:plasmid maintenance system antidote protein VapI
MLAINLQRPIRLRKATARQALNVQRFVTQTIVSAGDLVSPALADKIVRYYGGFEIFF